MARQSGRGVVARGKFETVYGTPPSGDWVALPFLSTDFGGDQPLEPDDLLGLGRLPRTPTQDTLTVAGRHDIPLDAIYSGFWLKGLMGAPTTTGSSAPYTHTFKSSVVTSPATFPSLALELGFPSVPSYDIGAGVRVGALTIPFATRGKARASVDLRAQGISEGNGTSGAGTPVEYAVTRFANRHGSIKKDTVALANVTGGQLVISNDLDIVETIRPDAKIEGADPGGFRASGNLVLRFADLTLVNAATAFTALALELGFVIDANASLLFTLPKVRLSKPKKPVTGPGGVSVRFDFEAEIDTGTGEALTAVLINGQAGTIYA